MSFPPRGATVLSNPPPSGSFSSSCESSSETIASLNQQEQLVACNVYISAGQKHHAPILLSLLKQAQSQARQLTHNRRIHPDGGVGVSVVHAYTDGPYDRSSLHFAGDGESVASLASTVAVSAIDALLAYKGEGREQHNVSSRHPLVGLVDHISIMPLVNDVPRSVNDKASDDPPSPDELNLNSNVGASRAAALQVAKVLEEQRGVTVQMYGTAHPTCKPLAQVRRETSFFQSTSLTSSQETEECSSNSFVGSCTVGSPPNFVENYNIRFSSHVPFSIAKTLTKRVRGIPGVEALTLKYSDNRYEVACNLTQPHQGSMLKVRECLGQWLNQNGQLLQGNDLRTIEEECPWVDTTYRVGTTVDQCIQVLDIWKCEETMKRHDEVVEQQFKNGFLY